MTNDSTAVDFGINLLEEEIEGQRIFPVGNTIC